MIYSSSFNHILFYAVIPLLLTLSFSCFAFLLHSLFKDCVAPNAYCEYVDEYCAAELDEAVAHIVCPVLLLWGASDPARTLYGGAEALVDKLPRTTKRSVVVVHTKKAIVAHGHDLCFPGRFALTVKKFFKRIEDEE